MNTPTPKTTPIDTEKAGAESLGCLTSNLRKLTGPAWTWGLLHNYAILDALLDVLRDIAENEIRTLDVLEAWRDAEGPRGTEYFVADLRMSHALFRKAIRIGTGPTTVYSGAGRGTSGPFMEIWRVINDSELFSPYDDRFVPIKQVLRMAES